jgi:1-aminocyclopropane-1-carboxylate deaminase/D-cysteine desulfhydrase-like pyridoxal-dependent ACC family enzyme
VGAPGRGREVRLTLRSTEYGEAEPETLQMIRRFARCEGTVADPVYEGKALRGSAKLVGEDRFDPAAKVLVFVLDQQPVTRRGRQVTGC